MSLLTSSLVEHGSTRDYKPIGLIYLGIWAIYIFMLVVFLLTVKSCNRIWEKCQDGWKKFPEYPLFDHDHYMLSKVYSKVQLLVAVIFVLHFVAFIPVSGILFLALAAICGLALILIGLTYVLIVFGQVHMVFLSIIVWEDIIQSKTLSDSEIANKQIEKRLLKKYLYRAFAVRDLILTPAIIYLDFAWKIKHRSFTPMALMIMHNAVYVSVPVVTLFYLRLRSQQNAVEESVPRLNILQKQVLRQAMTVTVVQMILLIISGFLTLFDKFSIDFNTSTSIGSFSPLLYAPHAIGVLLPMMIQITSYYGLRMTTVARVRRCREGEYSVSEC